MKRIAAFALLVMSMFVIGCNYNKGKNFTIELESNPTTGYEWEYSLDKEGIVEVEKDTYVPDENSNELVGAGGIQTYEIKGLKEGSVTLTLVYKRSWEDDTIETKKYVLEVDSNLNIKEIK